MPTSAALLVESFDLESFAVPRRHGREAGELQLDYVRELGREDVERLLAPQKKVSQPLARLRESHHSVARLVAGGMSDTVVALATGRSKEGVCLLQADPMFQELVAYYRQQVDEKFVEVHEHLAELGKAAVFELRDRMEADAEQFSIPELRKLAEFSLDRTLTAGTAPQRGPVKVEIEFVTARPEQKPFLDLEVEE